MWLHRFTNYLLFHRWQTLTIVFLGTFIPIIGMLGILIAALATLRKSIIEGGILALAATLPYTLSFYFSEHYRAAAPIVMWAAIGVAIISNILTWVFAVMLRRQSTWSQILQVAALLGVLVVSVTHLVFPEVGDWWGPQLQSYYSQALTGVWPKSISGTNDLQMEVINNTKQYATGVMVVAVLFNALLQLIIARWWQTLVYHPGSLHKELQSIRLSPLAGVLFVFSLILSYLGNSVILDIMPILYVLFGAAGLSLTHYLFKLAHSPMTWFWLMVLYMTLILSLPSSMILVAILALLDIWLNIRKRVRKIS